MAPNRWPDRFVNVPWDPACAPSDLRPQQAAITHDCRPNGKPERHFVLPVTGERTQATLCLLAIRCERRGDASIPGTLMIVDEEKLATEDGHIF